MPHITAQIKSAQPETGRGTYLRYRIFTWAHLFRHQLNIKWQAESPLYISHTPMSFGFTLSLMWTLKVNNRSDKAIDSFHLSYFSKNQANTGSGLWQPLSPLQPGQSTSVSIGMNNRDKMMVVVDFVQFANGTFWHSDIPLNNITQDSIKAGALAAASYLLSVWGSSGPSAVINALDSIHEYVDAPSFPPRQDLGFYCGVRNLTLQVQHLYNEGGLLAVESMLRRLSDG
jgi:hypothetical protein